MATAPTVPFNPEIQAALKEEEPDLAYVVDALDRAEAVLSVAPPQAHRELRTALAELRKELPLAVLSLETVDGRLLAAHFTLLLTRFSTALRQIAYEVTS